MVLFFLALLDPFLFPFLPVTRASLVDHSCFHRHHLGERFSLLALLLLSVSAAAAVLHRPVEANMLEVLRFPRQLQSLGHGRTYMRLRAYMFPSDVPNKDVVICRSVLPVVLLPVVPLRLPIFLHPNPVPSFYGCSSPVHLIQES